MARRTSRGARRAIIGRYADWIKRFDVQEYLDNPPLIEKLQEEKQLAPTQGRRYNRAAEMANGSG